MTSAQIYGRIDGLARLYDQSLSQEGPDLCVSGHQRHRYMQLQFTACLWLGAAVWHMPPCLLILYVSLGIPCICSQLWPQNHADDVFLHRQRPHAVLVGFICCVFLSRHFYVRTMCALTCVCKPRQRVLRRGVEMRRSSRKASDPKVTLGVRKPSSFLRVATDQRIAAVDAIEQCRARCAICLCMRSGNVAWFWVLWAIENGDCSQR